MKLKYITSLLLLFTVTFGSCVKDNTVDEFMELNKVEISGLEPAYSVMLYKHLVINPVVKTTQNDESQLSYVWYSYSKTSRKCDTLGTAKNLDVEITPSQLAVGEDYTLVFKAIDNTTGVHYKEMMHLNVTTEFSKGIVLLCEESGHSQVNFYQYSGNVIEKVYRNANNSGLGDHPLKVYSINPNAYAPDMHQVLFFCGNNTCGQVARPESFQQIYPMSEAVAKDMEGGSPSDACYFRGQMIDYVVMDGSVHKRAVNMGALTWEPALVVVNTPSTYHMAADVLDMPMPLFFDEMHGRLVNHERFNMGSLSVVKRVADDPRIFDPADMGENQELVCWGKLSEPRFGAWMLLKDKASGEYTVYTFSMNRGFRSLGKYRVDDKIAPHLKDAKAFASNQNFSDMFCFATDDAIYSFSVNQLSGENQMAEAVQADLGARNMTCDGLKFEQITVSAPTESDPLATRISQQLRAYVQDGNVSGEAKGGFIIYEIESVGGIHATEINKLTGFCGKIVDMAEKYD